MPYGDFEHDPDGTITGIEDGDGNDLPATGDGSSLEIYHGLHGLWRDPATGHYNARSRIYNPPIGRYLQPDPNGQAFTQRTRHRTRQPQSPF